MDKNNYIKAYTEIVEILKYLPEESVNKIPEEMISMFQEKMDKNYVFKIDVNKSFDEQDLLEETKAILANIFRDYWATSYQKERIIAKEIYDRQKLEEEKREQSNLNNLFTENVKDNMLKQKNDLCINIKKETFYHKLINFIKKFIHF